MMSMHGEPCWIGTSWKMNKTLAEAQAFADGLLAAGRGADPRIRRFVVPPFTLVREVKSLLAGSGVRVGAQDMHWQDQGAWTGEVSAPMLVDCSLDLVELGHSERRAHFGETDERVGRKVANALRHALVPLICIGETLEERRAGRADERLRAQVEAALAFIEPGESSTRILFAYEPVWAIGENGVPASADYADRRQAHIRQVAGARLGVAPPCLYGGSVNADNCVDLLAREHVDGLFIGRAAWNVEGYLDILARCSAVL